MLWVCKLLQLNHLRLQTLVRLVAKPTYQPHQTLRHGWIYEITFWNLPSLPSGKKYQLTVVSLDKHCGPHACSIQIWITRTPPPPHLLTHQLSINTSVFHQASLGHTGTLHRIPGSAVNCNKEWQRAPWPAEILLGEHAKNTKLSSPIGHWEVLGSGLGCIIDICWWSLLVYEGFLAICQIQYTTPYYLDHPLRYFVTCLHIYLYIYIENIYI